MSYEHGPKTAQRFETEMGQAARGWHDRFGEPAVTAKPPANEINKPEEMRFSPHTGDVTARSHTDLMNAGIIIPTATVERTWGKEAGIEYQAWQVEKTRNRQPMSIPIEPTQGSMLLPSDKQA